MYHRLQLLTSRRPRLLGHIKERHVERIQTRARLSFAPHFWRAAHKAQKTAATMMTMVSRRQRLPLLVLFFSLALLSLVNGFQVSPLIQKRASLPALRQSTSTSDDRTNIGPFDVTITEQMAQSLVSSDYLTNPSELQKYVQYVTIFRVGLPAAAAASAACLAYPGLSYALAGIIDDQGAFSVIAQDSSQYIQNILTTCGLMFSLLTGYTWYFLYTQQEAIFFALYEETTAVKTLLEQIALVCEGRKEMYHDILNSIKRYVREDMTQFTVEPSILLSSRPVDDPLQDIMYLTSVGEPSIVYQSVKELRQARAHRLGALQRKLPPIHLILLWTLAGIVLCTFPVLGAGVQTIGGPGILSVQSWYLSFIVFGITSTLGVVNELYKPAGNGAYNVVTVLSVMVDGLEEELEGRFADKYITSFLAPTNDVTKPSWRESYGDEEVLVESELPTLEAVPLPASAKVESESDGSGLASENSSSGPWFGRRIVNRFRSGSKQ